MPAKKVHVVTGEDQLRSAGIGLAILEQTDELRRQQRVKIAAQIVDHQQGAVAKAGDRIAEVARSGCLSSATRESSCSSLIDA